jgi:hypothetical protein
MALVVSISLEDIFTRLRSLVLDAVSPSGSPPVAVPVIRGLANRTSMPPPVPGFVAMTATLLTQHRTPVEVWDTDNPDPSAIEIEQGQLVRIQLDCYGSASADWATILATILRSDYACRQFSAGGLDAAPLYADFPVQAPLVNGEQQYEERWIVGANLQYNPVVSTPMQFADTLEATLINVDEAFPP